MDVTKNDIANLLMQIDFLKSRTDLLQEENNILRARVNESTAHIFKEIDGMNARVTRLQEMDSHSIRVLFEHLIRMGITVEQLQAIAMPTVAAFESEVANVIGAASYGAPEGHPPQRAS